MLVVTWDPGGVSNCVIIEGRPYIYARTTAGEFVLNVRCAHRGGPLHLATFRPGTTRLVCPWHSRMTSVTKALRAGIPAVRRGDRVTAVFDVPATVTAEVGYRPVSADLAC